jgi:hypothetical protein
VNGKSHISKDYFYHSRTKGTKLKKICNFTRLFVLWRRPFSSQKHMKKIFFFALVAALFSSVLAVDVGYDSDSGVEFSTTVPYKDATSSVTHGEFNTILGVLRGIFNTGGKVGIGGAADSSKSLKVTGGAVIDELCLSGNCLSTWPSGGTSMTLVAERWCRADADGTSIVCDQETPTGTEDPVWISSASGVAYNDQSGATSSAVTLPQNTVFIVGRDPNTITDPQNLQSLEVDGAIKIGNVGMAPATPGTIYFDGSDFFAVPSSGTPTSLLNSGGPAQVTGNLWSTGQNSSIVTPSTFSGNVGIGITDPQEALHIDGAIIVGNSASTIPILGTIRYNSSTHTFEGLKYQQGWVALDSQGSTASNLWTYVSPNAWLPNMSANVGIGTSGAPASGKKLEVAGDARLGSASGNKFLEVRTTTSDAGVFFLDSSGTAEMQLKSKMTQDSNKALFVNNGTGGAVAVFTEDSNESSTPALGINEDNPQYTLDVDGDVHFTGELIQSGTGDVIFPGTVKLANYFKISSNSTSGIISADFVDSSGNTEMFVKMEEIRDFQSPGIFIGAPNKNILTVASVERVGVNQEEPEYELDVTGDINFTGDLYQDGSNDISLGGDLDVAGDLDITGTAQIGDDVTLLNQSVVNNLIVGEHSGTCDSTKKGMFRFRINGQFQSLEVCMKETGSNTYGWRQILGGGYDSSMQ